MTVPFGWTGQLIRPTMAPAAVPRIRSASPSYARSTNAHEQRIFAMSPRKTDAKEAKPWQKEKTSINDGPPPVPRDVLYTSSTKIDVRCRNEPPRPIAVSVPRVHFAVCNATVCPVEAQQCGNRRQATPLGAPCDTQGDRTTRWKKKQRLALQQRNISG